MRRKAMWQTQNCWPDEPGKYTDLPYADLDFKRIWALHVLAGAVTLILAMWLSPRVSITMLLGLTPASVFSLFASFAFAFASRVRA